jgi:hypothetical protein
MSVTSFFESLFHTPPKGQPASIFKAKGYVVTSTKVSTYNKPFSTHFADSKFYFNHWIKVHQSALLNVKYLLSLLCRGAAVQCANSQLGVDGLMPFLWRGTKLSRDNLGVCMWQAKNDSSFTHQIDQSLFEAMDPFTLKIFGDDSGCDIPVIRIVFALAADTPSVQVATVRHTTNHKCKSYITYDIWCSGLSPDHLLPITAGKEDAWHALLQRSHGWQDVYSGDEGTKRLRRSMNPGAALDADHWSQWNDIDLFR